jgi:hypothetical protein
MSCALHFLPASTQQHPYRAAASFRPVYVDYSNKYNAGRLPPAYLRFRKDPAKYLTAYARATGPDIFTLRRHARLKTEESKSHLRARACP